MEYHGIHAVRIPRNEEKRAHGDYSNTAQISELCSEFVCFRQPPCNNNAVMLFSQCHVDD